MGAPYGPHRTRIKECIYAFDADLYHYEENRSLYKYIQPRQEHMSWIVSCRPRKIYRGGIVTLAEAVSIRDKLMGDI